MGAPCRGRYNTITQAITVMKQRPWCAGEQLALVAMLITLSGAEQHSTFPDAATVVPEDTILMQTRKEDAEIAKVDAEIPSMNKYLGMATGGKDTLHLNYRITHKGKECALQTTEQLQGDAELKNDASWGSVGKWASGAAKKVGHWFTKDVPHWFTKELPCASGGYNIKISELGGLKSFAIDDFAGTAGDHKFSLDASAPEIWVRGHYHVEGKVLGIGVPLSGDFKAEGLRLNMSLPFSYGRNGCKVTSLKERQGGTVTIGALHVQARGVPAFVTNAIMSMFMTPSKLSKLLEKKALPILAKKVNRMATKIFDGKLFDAKTFPLLAGAKVKIDYCFKGT